MKRLFIALAACALASCTPSPLRPVAAADCSQSVDRAVRFSSAEINDVITVASSGPSCAQAVLNFTLRSADGDPLWTFATTLHDMGGPEAPTPEDVQVLLTRWVTVEVTHTGTLPEWRQGAESLGDSVDEGGSYETPFARETYEALRSRHLPLLCFLNSRESSQCLIIDPASGAPTVIVFRGA